VSYINRYRLLLYTEYSKYKLFDNVYHKIAVQNYGEYYGVPVPPDVDGVEAVWSCGDPLLIRSRWREAHFGLGVHSLGRVEVISAAQQFPTERDLGKASKIKIFTEHEDDAGKVVKLEVLDQNCRSKCIALTLIGDGFAVSPYKISQIISVSLPAERKGALVLAQDDGRVLSEYAPWETVPAYRRLKINDRKCASTVVVQASQKYIPVHFDQDVVEVGNQLIIEAAARFFKYGETTTESKEITRAEYDRAEMDRLLKSAIARQRGRAVQDGSPFRGKRVTAHTDLYRPKRR
jgi:hypothetical protein